MVPTLEIVATNGKTNREGYLHSLTNPPGQRGKLWPITPKMKTQLKPRPSFPGGWITPGQGSDQCCMKAEGAKNHRAGPGCHLMMNLAYYNGRSLSSEPRLQELEEELLKIKWDVTGLSEVKRNGEGQIQLQNGHIFYYRGTENGKNSEAGFIINKRLKDTILEVDSSSGRVARLVLRLSKRYKLQIIQVYAPTTSHPDEEIEDFYDEIKQMNEKGKHYVKIIMGDFNARIGKKEKNETSVGKFGHVGKFGNKRGDMLVDFAEAEKFYIMNSFFKKKSCRKWTWRHPNGGKYESDYILSKKQHNVENCNVLNRFNTGSHHRLVRCRLHLNTRLERRKLMRTTNSVDLKNLKEQHETFEMELKNRFSVLENLTEEETDISEINRQITKIIMETAAKIGGYVIRKTDKKIIEKNKTIDGQKKDDEEN
ncbi:uncharacterized protein LOC111631804 [Centruroides sculpturatus]|uniref:uncharacterized protein LOC111631804 n=1 Tax=Centruroides sculpturatus TaxID=218467 RepID=UPI000C6EE913|nr:uncharacterized protein LOC111631804 [Centruroides sculpturatus]